MNRLKNVKSQNIGGIRGINQGTKMCPIKMISKFYNLKRYVGFTM